MLDALISNMTSFPSDRDECTARDIVQLAGDVLAHRVLTRVIV